MSKTYLYHVTFIRNLPSIKRVGLVVSGGSSNFSSSYRSHSRDRIFWTSWEGVFYWLSKMEDSANHKSDDPIDDGMIPVVLKVKRRVLADLFADEIGSKDARNDAYYSEDTVPAKVIKFWDGEDWEKLKYADVESLLEEAREAADEDEYGVYPDFEVFLPLDP